VDDSPGSLATPRATRGADTGFATLDEIGRELGLTRERVRQIQCVAIRKMHAGLARLGVHDADMASGESMAEALELGGGAAHAVVRARDAEGPSGFGAGEAKERAGVEREAADFADRVLSFRRAGASMRAAWSRANDCPPPRDERKAIAMTSTNGIGHGKTPGPTVTKGEAKAKAATPTAAPAAAPSSIESTDVLVAAVEAAKTILRARRDALRAELELATRALGGEGAPDASGSRRGRVLSYLGEHPRATAGEIASALEDDAGAVSGALCFLRSAGRATSAGTKGSLRWSLR
jgi:Sigma-70, region 4